jgi:hypothetical protein
MKRNGSLKRELIRQDNPTLVGLAPPENPTPHMQTHTHGLSLFHLQRDWWWWWWWCWCSIASGWVDALASSYHHNHPSLFVSKLPSILGFKVYNVLSVDWFIYVYSFCLLSFFCLGLCVFVCSCGLMNH